MPTYALTDVSDRPLLDDLAGLVANDRETTAALLAHIAEVDARQLYLPAACSSMQMYCMRVLHFSEGAAAPRARAGDFRRCSMRSPTGASISRASCCWRLTPKPDVPQRIRAIASRLVSAPLPELAPGPVAAKREGDSAPREAAGAGAVRPPDDDQPGDAGQADRAKALMRYRNPSGDLAVVLDRAVEANVAESSTLPLFEASALPLFRGRARSAPRARRSATRPCSCPTRRAGR
jgi:hypothetical protein